MRPRNIKYGRTSCRNSWELGILLMAIHVLPLCIGQSTKPQAASQVPQKQPTAESGVSQPTTATNVSQPMTASNISQPMTASNVSQPTTATNVSQPMTASNISQPMTASNVSQPTTATNVSQPTAESGVSQPTTATNVSQPMTASNISQPMTASNVPQPTTASNVSQPTTASNVSQPTIESNVSQPTSESNVSQPMTASNVSQPTTATNVSQPTAESGVSQPTTESKVSQPTTESIVSQPTIESNDEQSQSTTAINDWQSSESCSSDSCTLIASKIVENMDNFADPCTDFYEFACGNFVHSIDIPEGKQSISNKDVLLLELSRRIKSMIVAEVEPEEPKPFQILKKFYKLCMSRSVNDHQKNEELKNFLKERGGWPVLEGESWKYTYFNWKQKLKKFRADGEHLGEFIGLRIDKDPKDESSRIITLFQPKDFFEPGISETAFNAPWMRAYYQVVVDVAVALGADKTYASVELKEAFLLEMKLANIKLSDEEIAKLNPFNLMTIRELNRIYPSVPWIENIKTILSSPDFNISEDESINVPVPEYYVKLEKLMAETHPRVTANYVLLKIALRNAMYSSEKIRGIIYRFFTELLENVKPLDVIREKFCSSQVLANFWLVFNIMFVRKYLPTGAENRVNEIRNSVKEEFIAMVNQITNDVDESTISALLAVADTIQNVNYPSEQDIIRLEKLYENLVVNESSFFDSMHELSKFDTTLQVRELRNPVSENDLILNFEETSINPTVLTQQKYILVPEKLIQILYVSNQGSSYIGFSTIAINTGRNIVDALDDNDDTKKLSNCEESVLKKFGNYSISNEEFEVNDKRTLKEIRRDFRSLRLAYDAYGTWAATRDDSLKLPQLENYTAKQMFWLSAASNICTKYATIGTGHKTENSSPVPAKLRVNIALANMPEFGNDFECSPLSPMRAKCSCCIW